MKPPRPDPGDGAPNLPSSPLVAAAEAPEFVLLAPARGPQHSAMADLYLKALESERKQLWATCRLKGLPRDTPERQRIAALDEAIAAHKAKKSG